MGTPPRLFGRQKSVHEILGGGFVADVMLWRRANVTIGVLIGTLAAWMVFQVSGHSLLSLVADVLFLLISILFLWAKAAALLNRPPPPIPEMHLSGDAVKKAVVFVHSNTNVVLSGFHDIALGKDSNLFFRVSVWLCLISIVGSCTDFLTLSCTSLVIFLTVPVLYEKYQDTIDKYVTLALIEMLQYEKVYAEYFDKFKDWVLEKKVEIS